jgi:hypothetical protein
MLSKIVSSFSLFLICTLCWSADYVALRAQLTVVKNPQAVLHILKGTPDLDQQIREKVGELDEDVTDSEIAPIRDMVDARADIQSKASSGDAAVGSTAKKIKASPMYRDAGPAEGANWLRAALDKLQNMFSGAQRPTPDIKAPEVNAGGLGTIILYGVAGILGIFIIVFLFFVFRHFEWKRKLKRKASALLDEDEPQRSADEWLNLADALVGQGRFREAVRCLYLACLLRFDEADVARFNRSETNWEHLSRIQGSAKRPPELDFMPPTQAFDRIWYGQRVRGIEDVDQFRIWYGQATKSLMGAKS